jgi:hypothetical protein
VCLCVCVCVWGWLTPAPLLSLSPAHTPSAPLPPVSPPPRSEKYASLYAECADWGFTHLSDSKFGEWFGYADRDGAVTHRFKGGPYKGCFHVPRSLFMCEGLLAKALAKATAAGK